MSFCYKCIWFIRSDIIWITTWGKKKKKKKKDGLETSKDEQFSEANSLKSKTLTLKVSYKSTYSRFLKNCTVYQQLI